jgi:hypothetical protein
MHGYQKCYGNICSFFAVTYIKRISCRKMMFMDPTSKQEILKFDGNAPIYCPTDQDRFQTR